MLRKLWIVALLLPLCGLALRPRVEAAEASPVRIGMVASIFADVPPALVQILSPSFGTMMKEFTGLDGTLIVGGDPFDVSKDLKEGKLQLAVFHGFEFAWAQERDPALKPLLVAVNKHRSLQAHLVVRNDCNAACVSELKGEAFALARKTREHCKLFLDKQCQTTTGTDAKTCFVVANPSHPEAALDAVASGKAKATVVDTLALDAYRDIKPSVFARLKVLKQSEHFPTGVVAYREGSLPPALVARFREGMIAANKTDRGRDMLSMWKITAFELVPGDYQKTLADILRAYPAPSEPTKISRQ
ncbi:MAG: phosphate/phosphite/phosphonate ABC transporter substrate-binding protein [Gemmataceae bacterium]|nr:phosphate/phosphite/phosphonate ABC transporter substrate-binding protein [Gemmataceae bacterium]